MNKWLIITGAVVFGLVFGIGGAMAGPVSAVVYTQTDCPHCVNLERALQDNGIKYHTVNDDSGKKSPVHPYTVVMKDGKVINTFIGNPPDLKSKLGG